MIIILNYLLNLTNILTLEILLIVTFALIILFLVTIFALIVYHHYQFSHPINLDQQILVKFQIFLSTFKDHLLFFAIINFNLRIIFRFHFKLMYLFFFDKIYLFKFF